MEVKANNGLAATVGYFFSDRVPLNDVNGEYANAYHLLHLKFGYEVSAGERWRLKIQVGAENLLDQKYSLGNDIKAAGGRYYNAAPLRSFYLSFTAGFLAKQKE